MLEGLRVASQNWVGRILMGLVMGFIAITFAVWGIGNDMLSGFSSQRLARVGSTEISLTAYKRAYQSELQRLQQRLRRAITKEEARRAGLDQQILERLITDAALDQKAQSLGLAISEEQTQKLLKSEKVFQGPNGGFDTNRFKQIIRDAGFDERSFLVDQRATYLRKEITDTVSAGIEPPRVMVEAIYRFRNETRAIDYLVLPASAVGPIAAPTEEATKKYYDEHEQAFRAKEYRKVTLLAVTPSNQSKSADIPEADVRGLYDSVKDKRFGSPEKRDVRQIVFKTEDEAKQAAARLAAGLSFDDLIAERKLSAKDVELGLIEPRDIGDAKVAAAAFAIPAPGLAEPVATPFGTVLSQVRKIVPGVYTKTYEQAAPELRSELALQKATPEARRLHDAIEDQRSSGKPLAETAKAVGLEAITIDAIDDAGRDKNGKEISPPGGPDLVKAAFASDVGVDNDTVTTRDGGYVWFEVAKIDAARQQTYEEVKGAVETAMRAEAAQKALTDKSNELVEKLRSGKTMDDLGRDLKIDVKRVTDVKRAARPDFSTETIVKFFDGPVKSAGATPVEEGRLVFFIQDSTSPKFDPTSIEARTIAEQLKPAVVNDLLEQYVGGLEKALNVEINQRMLQLATGAETEN